MESLNLFDIIDEINEIDSYVFTDNNLLKKLSVEIKINNENENNILKYHDANLIKKYNSYVSTYNYIKENNDVCCICIDEHSLEHNVYFSCKHFVCKQCFNMAKMTFSLSTCPLCRSVIERCIYSSKYAIIALGIETKYNTFENGGYKSISIAYIPEYLNMKNKVIENIKYHDGNKAKEEFEMHLFGLMTEEYTLVLQNFKKMKEWLSDMLLKDFIYDDNILHD